MQPRPLLQTASDGHAMPVTRPPPSLRLARFVFLLNMLVAGAAAALTLLNPQTASHFNWSGFPASRSSTHEAQLLACVWVATVVCSALAIWRPLAFSASCCLSSSTRLPGLPLSPSQPCSLVAPICRLWLQPSLRCGSSYCPPPFPGAGCLLARLHMPSARMIEGVWCNQRG